MNISDYYNELRSAAETKATRNLAKARENEAFRSADNRLAAIERELAYAELAADNEKIAALASEKKELKSKTEKILASIGMKESDLSPDYRCKKCKDTGFADGVKCDCFDRALAAIGLDGIGVSSKNFPSFGEADEKKGLGPIYAKMRSFCEKFPDVLKKNVIFTGKTGTGKTYLAECVVGELLKKGFNAVMLTSFALNDVFLQYHSLFDSDRRESMNALILCDLLVIDDLGAERNIKNVTENYLLNLLGERAMRGAPTIFTSNLTGGEILERYGERIFGRMFDKRLAAVIEFAGKDMRLND